MVPLPVASNAAPPPWAKPAPRSSPSASWLLGSTSGTMGRSFSATKSSLSRSIIVRSSRDLGTSNDCQPDGPRTSPPPATATPADAASFGADAFGMGAGIGRRKARPRSSRTSLRPASCAMASRGRKTASCATCTGLRSERLSSGPSRRTAPCIVCHWTPLASRMVTVPARALTVTSRSGPSRCASADGIPSVPGRIESTTSRRPTMATVQSASAAPAMSHTSSDRTHAARVARMTVSPG